MFQKATKLSSAKQHLLVIAHRSKSSGWSTFRYEVIIGNILNRKSY